MTDVNIERAIDAGIVGAELERCRELFAAHDATRSARELHEQAKLERRKREINSAERYLLRGNVDDEIADDDARARVRLRFATPEHGVQTREELARVERFGNIVVGAEVETDDAIVVVAAGREHDHGYVAGLADFPADGESVVAGEHDVEQDGIEWVVVVAQKLESALAFGDDFELSFVSFEVFSKEISELSVVVDKKDPHVCEDVP